MTYLRCQFINDYEQKKPSYDTDSVSEMREALAYYEDVVSDMDCKMDSVFDYFKDYIKESGECNEDNVREFLENVSYEEYEWPRKNGIYSLMWEVMNSINKEKYPKEWEERQNKIMENQNKADKIKQENINEYLKYILDK